jgi:hypothetical protein
MRALPEVREPFWKTFVEVAKTNPGALRYIVMLMALYMHLGPFSKRVISEIDRRIAELDGMHSVRATESSDAMGLESFKEFPPRTKPASFSVGDVMEKLSTASANKN